MRANKWTGFGGAGAMLLVAAGVLAAPEARADHFERDAFARSGRLASLAYQVESLSRSLLETAQRQPPGLLMRGHFGGSSAIYRLDALVDEARAFRYEVQRYGRMRWRTDDDLFDLLHAYDRAARSIGALRPQGLVRRDAARLSFLMDALVDAYGMERDRYAPYLSHRFDGPAPGGPDPRDRRFPDRPVPPGRR